MNSRPHNHTARPLPDATRQRLQALLSDPNISDQQNPAFAFSLTATELLVAMAGGLIDPAVLVRQELANRGLDENGEWVGFDRAREIWEVR